MKNRNQINLKKMEQEKNEMEKDVSQTFGPNDLPDSNENNIKNPSDLKKIENYFDGNKINYARDHMPSSAVENRPNKNTQEEEKFHGRHHLKATKSDAGQSKEAQ
jgi:hypothetical protein